MFLGRALSQQGQRQPLILQLLIMPLCPACVHYVTCLFPASPAKEGFLVQGSSHQYPREHELSLATQLGQRSKFTKARERGCALDRGIRKEGARDSEKPRALGASSMSLQLLPLFTHIPEHTHPRLKLNAKLSHLQLGSWKPRNV